MNKRDKEIVEFISVLISRIPKYKWEKDGVFKMNTSENYNTLKEYFEIKMKELFGLEVKGNDFFN